MFSRKKKSQDKREIILEFLYNNKHTTANNMADLRPLMKDWTRDEIDHILDSMKHQQNVNNPLIFCPHLGEFSFVRLGLKNMDGTIVTRDNYKADAYITPAGERYYENYYLKPHQERKDRRWRRIGAPFTFLSTCVAIAIGTHDIYSWQTNEREAQQYQDTIGQLKKEKDSLIISNASQLQRV
jgi:hypothetical protein